MKPAFKYFDGETESDRVAHEATVRVPGGAWDQAVEQTLGELVATHGAMGLSEAMMALWAIWDARGYPMPLPGNHRVMRRITEGGYPSLTLAANFEVQSTAPAAERVPENDLATRLGYMAKALHDQERPEGMMTGPLYEALMLVHHCLPLLPRELTRHLEDSTAVVSPTPSVKTAPRR